MKVGEMKEYVIVCFSAHDGLDIFYEHEMKKNFLRKIRKTNSDLHPKKRFSEKKSNLKRHVRQN